MEISRDLARFEPCKQARDETEVGLVDKLVIGFERIGAVRNAINDGAWLNGFDQIIEIGIDQQIHYLHAILGDFFQAPSGQPGCSYKDILAIPQERQRYIPADKTAASEYKDGPLQMPYLLF